MVVLRSYPSVLNIKDTTSPLFYYFFYHLLVTTVLFQITLNLNTLKMIQQDFKYFVNAFILENLMYFINLKICANCLKCKEGFQQDSSHSCYTVVCRLHERADLLFYYNQAIFDVIDVLTLEFYLNDIQKAVHKKTFETSLQRSGIFAINSKYNIEGMIKSKESVHWRFDQFGDHIQMM